MSTLSAGAKTCGPNTDDEGGCEVIERFSTRGLDMGDRLEFWNQLLEGTYGGLVVDPLQPQFHAQMARWKLGDMTMIWPQSAAAVVSRRRNAGRGAGEQKIIAHLLHSGECQLTQRGRVAELKAGDMVLCSDDDSYRFDVARDHQILVVEMNRSVLESRVGNLDDMVATTISGKQATTRLLHNFFLSLWREGASNFDESMGQSYASVLVEMLATSLHPQQQSVPFSRNLLFERMKGVVEAQLADSDLSPTSLASELGVSLRTLQSAVAEAGTTAVGYIAARRLARAAQRLAMEPAISVTQIAFSVGFADSAYFSRRFHDQFGLSPSEYRQRH